MIEIRNSEHLQRWLLESGHLARLWDRPRFFFDSDEFEAELAGVRVQYPQFTVAEAEARAALRMIGKEEGKCRAVVIGGRRPWTRRERIFLLAAIALGAVIGLMLFAPRAHAQRGTENRKTKIEKQAGAQRDTVFHPIFVPAEFRPEASGTSFDNDFGIERAASAGYRAGRLGLARGPYRAGLLGLARSPYGSELHAALTGPTNADHFQGGQPGGIIIQLANSGSVLATTPAGLLQFNCSTGMSCSWAAGSGSNPPRFTLTSSGGGGGATLQTNGTNNASQTLLNLQNSAAFNGLTFTFSDPSGGNVQAGFSGTLNDAGLTSGYSGTGSCAAHNWINAVARNAAPTCAQPSFSDLAGTDSPSCANVTNGVCNNASNTGTSGMTLDMSASTSSTALKPPQISSPAPGTTPALSFDTAQFRTVGGDTKAGTISYPEVWSTASYDSSTPAAVCVGANVTCGTATTNCLQTTNTISNCTTMGAINTDTSFGWTQKIPANTLIGAKHIKIVLFYTQAFVSTAPIFIFKVKLCTVSGCGSGTVTTLYSSGSVTPSINFTGASIHYDILGTATAGAGANILFAVDMAASGGSSQPVTRQPNGAVQPIAVATNADEFITFTLSFSSLATAGNFVRILGAQVMCLN